MSGIVQAIIFGKGGSGSRGASSVVTNDQPIELLKYDRDYDSALPLKLDLTTGNKILSLDVAANNIVGNSRFFAVEADGVHSIILGSGFATLKGSISPSDLSGKILDAGTYLFLTHYSSNGILINVPALSSAPTIQGPTIESFSLDSNNNYVDITFNQGVYGDSGATTPIVLADLKVSNFVAGGVTALSLGAVTNTSGGALTGGESVVRATLVKTGTPNGLETFEIQPNDAASIYNSSGGAMNASETTGTITLIAGTALSFTTTTNFNLDSPNVWIGAQGAGQIYLGYGLADQSFAGDGYVTCDITTLGDDRPMIGFKDTNSNGSFSTYNYYVAENDTNYTYGENGGAAIGSGVARQSGDKVRLRRTGTTIYAEYYRGGSWSLIHQFATPYAGTIYTQIAIRDNWKYARNPKLF